MTATLAALIAISAVLTLLLTVGIVRWWAARATDDDVFAEDDELETSVEPSLMLPEGHRPPVGLGPISPSERFLSAETERGLRDLQAFLLDAA